VDLDGPGATREVAGRLLEYGPMNEKVLGDSWKMIQEGEKAEDRPENAKRGTVNTGCKGQRVI